MPTSVSKIVATTTGRGSTSMQPLSATSVRALDMAKERQLKLAKAQPAPASSDGKKKKRKPRNKRFLARIAAKNSDSTPAEDGDRSDA